jgi:hypothetical protein
MCNMDGTSQNYTLLLLFVGLDQGWPDFFARRPNLNIFFSGAVPFKFSYNFCKAEISESLFDAYWEELSTNFLKFCLNGLILFAFPSNRTAPRTAKISWRAAL